MLVFKKELDTTELIKWGTATLGAVISFWLVQYTEVKIEVAKAKKEAIQEIIKHAPRARINYTNQLSSDGSLLEVKVYLMPLSEGELYVYPPKLTLYGEKEKEIVTQQYHPLDLDQFQGSFIPKVAYQINYHIKLSKGIQGKISQVKLEYEIQTSNISTAAQKWYLSELQDIQESFSDPDHEVFVSSSVKKLIYREKVYAFGTNPIWQDFYQNPR